MSIAPFLYQDLVDRILASARDWQRLLILAGRGLGKTSLLKRLQEEHEELGIEVEWLDRTTPEPARAIELWASDPEGILLIDDLDRIFDEGVEEALHSLSEDPDGGWRIIVTVCRLEDLEETLSWSGSPSLNTFHREILDPWEIPGQASGAIKDALPHLRQAHRDAGHGWPLHAMLQGQTPNLVEAWVQEIVSLSEGHPALLSSAFNALARLLLRYPQVPVFQQRLLSLPEDRDDFEEWRQGVMHYLTDEIFNSAEGMGVVQTAIYYFRKNSSDFESLVKLARSEKGERIDDVRLRHSLRSSGLVYRHPGTGKLKVAGALARQKILAIAGVTDDSSSSAESSKAGGDPKPRKSRKPRKRKAPKSKVFQRFRISLEPDPESEGDGTLHIHEPEGHESMAIKGSEWAVLRAIALASGEETVRVEQIRESTLIDTDAAVRSALQRLRAKLRARGLGDLIETVRGKGFRLRRLE